MLWMPRLPPRPPVLGTAPLSRNGQVEALRVLRLARASAVKDRTKALQQIDQLLVTGPAPLRDQLRQLSRRKLIGRCAAWRPDSQQAGDPVVATRIALQQLARRYLQLDEEISHSDALLDGMVTELAPQLIAVAGIGTETAARSCSPSATTPTGCTAKPRSRCCAGWRHCRLPPAKPSGTGSTAAGTGKPTGPSTSSPPPGNAATRAPRPTSTKNLLNNTLGASHPQPETPHRPRGLLPAPPAPHTGRFLHLGQPAGAQARSRWSPPRAERP
jgi:hypothetical protein